MTWIAGEMLVQENQDYMRVWWEWKFSCTVVPQMYCTYMRQTTGQQGFDYLVVLISSSVSLQMQSQSTDARYDGTQSHCDLEWSLLHFMLSRTFQIWFSGNTIHRYHTTFPSWHVYTISLRWLMTPAIFLYKVDTTLNASIFHNLTWHFLLEMLTG